MRKYTTDNPKFQESIDIVEETDPGHADNLTPSLKQLLQNSLVLKNGDNETGFSSGDEGNPDSWSDIDIIESRESPKTLFGKLSTAVKNVRWLYKLLGTTDISGLGEGKAKGTVTGAISKLNTDLVNRIYPVGSVYLSINATNPGTLFGGEWVAWGSGCVPVGVDPADTDFNAAGKTGGAKAVTLSESNLPSHKHTIGAHSHGLNSHTHAFTTGNQSANHTHSGTTGEESVPHAHIIPALSGTAASAGAHTHTVTNKFYQTGAAGSSKAIMGREGTETTTNGTANSAGAHTHSVTTNSTVTGGNGGSHTHTFTTGNNSSSHTHSGTTGGASGSTANSTQFDSGSAGSGTAHSNLQPYITCYMWKRTA